MIRFDSLPELSLYVHMPWCVRKCPYCDFNSHELGPSFDEQGYVQALVKDLELALPEVWGRPVVSVFFGGGTPSLFSSSSIQWLMSELRARLKILPGAEITLEANPGAFEAERFEGYALAGVNRVSLGIQSFHDHHLKRLGRVHDGEQAVQAARHARAIFPEVNLDLMYGLADQTMDELLHDLDRAIELDTAHLSVYQLTLEPNTAFAARPPSGLPSDDLAAQMQDAVIGQLGQAGFGRYEVSAYSRPGHRCVHNLNYWTFGDYLGIGAGAHGKISSCDRIERTARYRHPRDYLRTVSQGQPVEIRKALAPQDLGFEFMLNGLRLVEGVAPGRWAQTTGTSLGQHLDLLERIGQAQARGLLERRTDRWKPTPKGLDFLSDLQAMFL